MNEARVGIITVLAILLLIAIFYQVGGYGMKDKGYTVTALFDYGSGIQDGAPVRLAGVDVGKVTGVAISSDHRARLTIWVRKEIELYDTYSFNISSGALLGDKFVDILPEPGDGIRLKEGSIVVGHAPVRIEDIMAQTRDIMDRASVALSALNQVIADPAVQQDFKDTMANLRLSSERAVALAAGLDAMVAENRTDVGAMVGSLKAMADNLNVASQAVREIAKEPTLVSEAKTAVEKIAVAGNKVSELMDNVNKVMGDEAFRSDVKGAVHEVRQGAENINAAMDLVKTLSATRVEPSLELDYLSRAGRMRGDVNVRLLPPGNKFFLLGVTDVGETGKLNLQAGQKLNEQQAIRLGIIESSIGVALDITGSERLRFSGELFNPGELKLNLHGYYRLSDKWDAHLGLRDLFKEPQIGMGVRYLP